MYHQIPIANHEKPHAAFVAWADLYQFQHIYFGATNGGASFQCTTNKKSKVEGVNDTFTYIDKVTTSVFTKVDHDRSLWRFLEVAANCSIILLL